MVIIKNALATPIRVTAVESRLRRGRIRIVLTAAPIRMPGWRLLVATTLTSLGHATVQIPRDIKDLADLELDNRVGAKVQTLIDRHGDTILLIKGFIC